MQLLMNDQKLGNLSKNMREYTAVLLTSILFSCAANAADTRRDPAVILNSLADRMYVLGETGGKVTDMIEAEKNAAAEVRQYVESGLTDGLLAKEKGKQSPLVAAAYMGYPDVVAALLTSDLLIMFLRQRAPGSFVWDTEVRARRQRLAWAPSPPSPSAG